MKNLTMRVALAVAMVSLMLAAGSGQAKAGTTYNFVFDDGGFGEPPPPVPPFVGSGTVTIANNPGDGTFALTSLGGFSMSFTFGAYSFSNSDIQTPLGEVLVVLTATAAGQQFQFSNSTPGGYGTGPYSGSIDFTNSSGAILSFEPPGFGGLNLYYSVSPSGGEVGGNYLGLAGLAVPEPSSLTLALIGGLGTFGYGFRRRRKVAV